ncbi:hypothetical protein BpHYR1_044671 [Brachionus plicatilis]|uniref:Uncharacterized protein n=1 Tax=Brachionus plicatilis TaxID=10195 RepID=A0A3M7T2W9_BRAPC|nr:hypothetical protein BpHYR1_044671 [Brachionus plicatilis]
MLTFQRLYKGGYVNYQSKKDDPGSTLLRLLGINVSEADSEDEDYTKYIESFEDFNVIKYLTHSVCKILHRKRFSTATNLLKVGICSPDSKLQKKPSFRSRLKNGWGKK